MGKDPDNGASLERRYRKVGEFIEGLAGVLAAKGVQGGALTGITVRMPTEEEPSALLVIRATGAKGKRVAFVGAYTLGDAFLAWRAQALAGSIKWREDIPWSQRSGGGKG